MNIQQEEEEEKEVIEEEVTVQVECKQSELD